MLSDPLHNFDHSIEVDSEYSQCQAVRDQIIALARSARYCERSLLALQLALQEAFVNAVKHGNENDASKKIWVDFSVRPSLVRVRIADEGEGFDPDAVPDPTAPENLVTPGGRGLLLMRQFMSRVQHHGCGNTIELWLEKGG